MTVVHASSAVLCRLGLGVGNQESGVGSREDDLIFQVSPNAEI